MNKLLISNTNSRNAPHKLDRWKSGSSEDFSWNLLGGFLSLLEAQMRYDLMRKKLIQLTQIE